MLIPDESLSWIYVINQAYLITELLNNNLILANIGPDGPEFIWHLWPINLIQEYNEHNEFIVVCISKAQCMPVQKVQNVNFLKNS